MLEYGCIGCLPGETKKATLASAGVPKEVFDGERRVAVTPTVVKTLLKQGFKGVLVESGAGGKAEFNVSHLVLVISAIACPGTDLVRIHLGCSSQFCVNSGCSKLLEHLKAAAARAIKATPSFCMYLASSHLQQHADWQSSKCVVYTFLPK
jgi:hypothetical protein